MTGKPDDLSADDKAAEAAMQEAFAEPTPKLPARDPATGQFQPADTATAAPARRPEPKAKAQEPVPSRQAAPAGFMITQEQWDAAMRDLETARKLSGSVGNLHTMVNQLRSATPTGVQIELPPEMEQEYPELAAHLKKAKISGTAPATATEAKSSISDEEVRRLIKDAAETAQNDVDQKLRLARQKVEAEYLDDLHPDWREIVGAGENPDPNNPFRKWLSGQSAQRQKLVNETDSAGVIARAIDDFKAAAKTPPANGTTQPPSAVNDRRRAAIQPKGDGGQPPASPNSEEEAFRRAFAS